MRNLFGVVVMVALMATDAIAAPAPPSAQLTIGAEVLERCSMGRSVTVAHEAVGYGNGAIGSCRPDSCTTALQMSHVTNVDDPAALGPAKSRASGY